MASVFIKHKVADFDSWLPHFEAHASFREAAGINKAMVWQDNADPNLVYVMFKVEDLAKAQEFAASPDLKEKMQAAGVQESPTIFFMDNGRKYDH